MLELLRALMPHVPLDRGVASAYTGHALLDTLPLLTMLPCAQVRTARGGTEIVRLAALHLSRAACPGPKPETRQPGLDCSW